MRALLTFMLADQEYGLNITDIQEVARLVAVTPLVEAPPEILGAINVRGVPTFVLDLRQRFGLPHQPMTHDSPLLLVKSRGLPLAALVDQVIGVTRTEARPDMAGVIRLDARLVVMLNPDNLLVEKTRSLLGRFESQEIDRPERG